MLTGACGVFVAVVGGVSVWGVYRAGKNIAKLLRK